MKPALAENVEEKERKHGEKRKSHDNLCPDSQHGAKLPTRRPWLQDSPTSTRQECSQPWPPWPRVSQGSFWCTRQKPSPGSQFCWKHLPFWRFSLWKTSQEHPLLPLSVLPLTILLPWYFTHQIELIMVLKLKGTTWILVTLTYTCYFPCYVCKQEPSGFSYHCYFSKAAQSNFPGTDIKFCSMNASVCGYRDVYAYEEFLQNN